MRRRRRSKPTENTRAGSPGKSLPAGGEHSAPLLAPLANLSSRQAILLAAGLIVLAAAAAYSNSFTGPFIFDDDYWIVGNSSIRYLSSIGEVLFPHNAGRVGGRPVIALTVAVNYALGGMNVWGYHAVNFAIHVLAALALLGVVRRTLTLPCLRERFGPAALPLAVAVTLLWMLHPLQTQAVTYIIQRTEALVGLFYLLVLYCVIRGATSTRSTRGSTLWYAAATLSCVLGMATKEVMATAPAIVLLYDRTFLAGSFREVWRRRYGLYLALAATWGVVAALLVSTGFHGGTTGLETRGFTPWTYLLTQPSVIVHYLRLAFWPAGLCLDYNWPPVESVGESAVPGILIVGLLGLTAWALVKRPAWGFLGAWFFVILAPTSSFVPVQDAAFDHRMYLSLAAIVAGAVLGAWAAGRQLVRRGMISSSALRVASGSLAMLLAVALGILTFQRNVNYQSKIAIWEDTIAKQPENSRAYDCLALALADSGRLDEAIANYRKALQLNPDFVEAHNNFGIALEDRGRGDEAIAQYQKALELRPNYAEAHNNLGSSLANRGQIDEAIAHYRKALESKPDDVPTHNNLGIALADRKQLDEAIEHFRTATELRPEFSEAHNNLALALADHGQLDEAIAHYQTALEIKPENAEIRTNLGVALAKRGRLDDAIIQHRKAAELRPQTVELHSILANALTRRGRLDEAIAEYRKALEIKPDNARARNGLGGVLNLQGKVHEAIAQWEDLIRAQPNYVPALNMFAWTLATNPEASIRNGARAVELARRAEQLTGGDPTVLNTLAAAYAEAGRFPEAVQTARKALDLATQKGNQPLMESIKGKIPLYEAGTPFHETQRPAARESAQP